jgi:hypothetical protein
VLMEMEDFCSNSGCAYHYSLVADSDEAFEKKLSGDQENEIKNQCLLF